MQLLHNFINQIPVVCVIGTDDPVQMFVFHDSVHSDTYMKFFLKAFICNNSYGISGFLKIYL